MSTVVPDRRAVGARWALLAGWIALAPAPLLIRLDPALATARVAMAVAVLVVAGSGLLLAAWRHDPHGEVIAGLVQSPVWWAAVTIVGLCAILAGVLLSGGTAMLVLLGSGILLFALWTASRSGRVLVERLGSVLLLAISVAATLGMGEVLFRLPAVAARTGGNTPGLNRWSAAHYDRLWTHNPLKLRSLHVTEAKRPGTFRIVTLGDSFTWGYVIGRTEDTWPYVLERNLVGTGRDVEVVNLGRNGYATVDEEAELRQIGWRFQPDLIILEYTLNDALPGRYSDYFHLYPLVPGLNDVLDRSSYLFSFINARYRDIQMRVRFPLGESALFADSAAGWKASQAALRSIAAQAASRHVPVVMAIFPLFTPGPMLEGKYPFLPLHAKVSAAGAAASMRVLDLWPVFRGNRDGRSWWAIPSDAHPNVEAHRRVGEYLAQQLLRLNLLPPARPDAP